LNLSEKKAYFKNIAIDTVEATQKRNVPLTIQGYVLIY